MIALRTNNSYRPLQNRAHCPRTDLLETAESFLLKADLPGYDKDDLDIQATSEYIVIKAIHKESNENEEESKSNIGFSRRINFPTRVSPNKAKISLENGVLSITMPKSEESKAVKLFPN